MLRFQHFGDSQAWGRLGASQKEKIKGTQTVTVLSMNSLSHVCDAICLGVCGMLLKKNKKKTLTDTL